MIDSQPKKRPIQNDKGNQLDKQGNRQSQLSKRQDNQMKLFEIEQSIQQILRNLKNLNIMNERLDNEKVDFEQTLDRIQNMKEYEDVKPIKRKIRINDILKQDKNEIIKLKEMTISNNPNEKKILLEDLLQKDKPVQIFVREVANSIFIVIYQEVTFTLLGIEKDDIDFEDEKDILLYYLSQVKLQFQVIYQEQSHSEKLTCCESTFFYPSIEDQIQKQSNPSICFLVGGDIGEIFIFQDIESCFQLSRRQVCTGTIQQIIVPEKNSYFQHQNICLVLSQLEHIYLFNFAKGIIIAQFGNQGSSGPGKFLSVSWHSSYEYFLSTRENGGIELWKIDQPIIDNIQQAYVTNKPPGNFFRKYIDMPYYQSWAIHVNQTGALLFSTFIEHILVTIDNNMILRFTCLDSKNNESYLNIHTTDLKLSSTEIVNIFAHNLDVYIVTKNRILIFSLSENADTQIVAKQISYEPQNFNHISITQDFKYVIGLKDRSLYLSYQKKFVPNQQQQ